MDLNKLSLGHKIVGAAGILLIVDLLFFPWHSIDLGFVTVTRSATESPNGFYGVLALLLATVMVVQVIVSNFTSVKMPDMPMPWGRIHMIAGIAVAALLLLKLLAETDALGFGSYLGIALGGALAYGGFLLNNDAGATT